METSRRPGLDLALIALLLLGGAVAGCGRDEGGQPAEGAATGEAGELPQDGAGMEPRIVTEHPVDAPGRPAEGERAAVAIEAEPAAAWVPHLTAANLEASVAFYRGLGFEIASQGDERVELAREGVRLVLVAAPAAAGDGAEAGTEAAGENAAPAAASPLVLHLIEDAGGDGGRTVRDPDGHRLAVPGGG